jgi:hypothetical protein
MSASRTLPVISHPEFPQVFNQAILARIRMVPSARTHLSRCDWEQADSSPRFQDGYQCMELGTVYDLKSDREFCPCHYNRLLAIRGLDEAAQ